MVISCLKRFPKKLKICNFINSIPPFVVNKQVMECSTIEKGTNHIKKIDKVIQNKQLRKTMKLPKNGLMIWLDKSNSSVLFDDKKSSDPHDVSILFEFIYNGMDHPVLIGLRRPLLQLFARTVPRIHKKILSAVDDQHSLEDIPIQIHLHGIDPLNQFLTNKDVFFNENIPSIEIGGVCYEFIRNPPDCNEIDIDLLPIVDCPVIAKYNLRPGSPTSVNPRFFWYVSEEGVPLALPEKTTGLESCAYSLDRWNFRYAGPIFYPKSEDIGKQLCVVVDLGPKTIIRCVLSKDLIKDRPSEPLIFEERQAQHCAESASNGCLRVMSYNVLADLYLDLNLPQQDLFFSYCPVQFQSFPYRYPLLLKELPGYKADLIFLQEVDDRLRSRYLPVFMREYGYEFCFKRKGLLVTEGMVTLYKTNNFSLIDSHDIWLTNLLNAEDYPENQDIIDLLDKNEEIKVGVMQKPAIIQLMALRCLWDSSSETILLTANTHLYFNPLHVNIKVLQALLCARYILRIVRKYRKEEPEAKIHYIFAGDFNAVKNEGVYELLCDGYLSKEHQCWLSKGLSLLDDISVDRIEYSGDSKRKKYFFNLTGDVSTNYTRHQINNIERGFDGCLDYIWGSQNIQVENIIPMPSEDLVRKYIALPSKICPSDHLPVVCDIILT